MKLVNLENISNKLNDSLDNINKICLSTSFSRFGRQKQLLLNENINIKEKAKSFKYYKDENSIDKILNHLDKIPQSFELNEVKEKPNRPTSDISREQATQSLRIKQIQDNNLLYDVKSKIIEKSIPGIKMEQQTKRKDLFCNNIKITDHILSENSAILYDKIKNNIQTRKKRIKQLTNYYSSINKQDHNTSKGSELSNNSNKDIKTHEWNHIILPIKFTKQTPRPSFVNKKKNPLNSNRFNNIEKMPKCLSNVRNCSTPNIKKYTRRKDLFVNVVNKTGKQYDIDDKLCKNRINTGQMEMNKNKQRKPMHNIIKDNSLDNVELQKSKKTQLMQGHVKSINCTNVIMDKMIDRDDGWFKQSEQYNLINGKYKNKWEYISNIYDFKNM